MLTNKTVEGYPGARYYGGADFADQVESLAIERACRLFGCAFANVQPHSGSNANAAVYKALLKPGDTILSMDINAGGHISHGHPATATGAQSTPSCTYGVSRRTSGSTTRRLARPGRREVRPKLIIAGGSAYPRAFDFARLGAIAESRSARSCWSTWRISRAGRGGPPSRSLSPRPCGHHDDLQEPARRAGRHDPVERSGAQPQS